MRKSVWSGGVCLFPGQRKQPLDAEGKRDSADRDFISLKTGPHKKTTQVIFAKKRMRLRAGEFPLRHGGLVGGIDRHQPARLKNSPGFAKLARVGAEEIGDIHGKDLIDRTGWPRERAEVSKTELH